MAEGRIELTPAEKRIVDHYVSVLDFLSRCGYLPGSVSFPLPEKAELRWPL